MENAADTQFQPCWLRGVPLRALAGGVGMVAAVFLKVSSQDRLHLDSPREFVKCRFLGPTPHLLSQDLRFKQASESF